MALSGPGNPVLNFFASQINDADGLLDTGGSFGAANHDAAHGINISGGRQGFDTTGVALASGSGHLANAQSGGDVALVSSGDAFVSFALGLAVDRTPPAIPMLPAAAVLALVAGLARFGARRGTSGRRSA